MLFADLDKLKIIKQYNYQTQTQILGDGSLLQGTIGQIANAAKIASQSMLDTSPALECVYTFIIKGDGIASDEEVADFLTAVNIVVGQFFNCLTLNEKRKRDYRLDVPDKLKALKINYGTLKKAVNNKTVADKFNVIIEYKDLKYILVDEKTVEPTEAATKEIEQEE